MMGCGSHNEQPLILFIRFVHVTVYEYMVCIYLKKIKRDYTGGFKVARVLGTLLMVRRGQGVIGC